MLIVMHANNHKNGAKGPPSSTVASHCTSSIFKFIVPRSRAGVPGVFSYLFIKRYNVASIGYIKLDVEGHEPVIMKSIIEACDKNPALWPRAIKYEHKHVKG